jgi:hypothetical protein
MHLKRGKATFNEGTTKRGGKTMIGRLSILGFGLCVAALLAGCALVRSVTTTGSGNIVTREEAFTGFDRLDVSHGFEVDILQGEAYSVLVRVDDNLEKELEVAKSGSTLRIGLRRNRSYSLRNATLEATVTMPDLTGLELSGGSRGTLTGFSSSRALSVDMSGGSNLRGNIEAGDARFELSGGSNATLAGSAGDLTLDASGGSGADLSAFAVVNANVEASGGSQLTVNPSGRLDVDASGGSRVYYLGSPTLGRVEKSGGAEVLHR